MALFLDSIKTEYDAIGLTTEIAIGSYISENIIKHIPSTTSVLRILQSRTRTFSDPIVNKTDSEFISINPLLQIITDNPRDSLTNRDLFLIENYKTQDGLLGMQECRPFDFGTLEFAVFEPFNNELDDFCFEMLGKWVSTTELSIVGRVAPS